MKTYIILCATLLAAAALVFPASAAITADFSYSVDSSNPLTIHFTDKSAGAPGNWFWQFNDGGAVSSEQNPTHTFSGEGEYRVYFAATDSNYGNEATAMKYLTVTSSGITEDNGGTSSGGSNSGGSSGGSPSGGGINFPSISFGGITIPNPFDLISEYIKLIKVMVVPSNYQK